MLLLSLKSTVRFSGAFSIHKASWWIPSEVLRKFTSKETNAADMIDSIVQPTVFEKWLDVELAEGRCVGVKTNIDTTEEIFKPKDLQDSNHWAHALYHPEELSYGMNIGAGSQSYSFWLGRMAIRLALEFPEYPILKDSYGRPQLVSDDNTKMYGSISHKQNIGIALVSKNNNDDTAGVGIDIEFISRPGKRSIAKRVLTKNETKALGNIPGITAEEEVMLRFSLKEAIYKAAHPLLCQYVNFKDAEVTPSPDGTATCIWFLESGAHENIVDMKAHWQKVDDQDQGYFLTSARVQGHLQNENDEECIPK